MRDRKIKIASLQLAVSDKSKQINLDNAAKKIQNLSGVDLIILPELWNIGFMSFQEYQEQAEDKDGPTMDLLRQAAVKANSYIHTGSFVERVRDNYFNSSFLISPTGEILANYKKVHLFGYQSLETKILTPGEQLSVVETPIGTIGMATCYDLRFPEMFRRMVEMGAEIFLVCSAWPYPRLEHWLMFNRIRAIENQAFLVSANSVGRNQGSILAGHSMVVDPWGVIMTSGGDEEVVLLTDLDLNKVTESRAQFPALADRTDWLNTG